MPRVSKADQRHEESASAARARKESALADLRELQRDKLRGELIEVREVELLWSRILSNCRSRILAIPSRLAQVLPVDEAARREAAACAMELIREALTELADETERGALDDPPDEAEPEAAPAPTKE
jgi:phage terminase Nu1 subunit (DNA packaging protein)